MTYPDPFTELVDLLAETTEIAESIVAHDNDQIPYVLRQIHNTATRLNQRKPPLNTPILEIYQDGSGSIGTGPARFEFATLTELAERIIIGLQVP